MLEIDRLKSIVVSNCPDYINNILEASQINKKPTLWNIFCLLCNRHTMWDGKDYKLEIKRFINDFVKDKPELSYLSVIVNNYYDKDHRKMGLAFDTVNSLSHTHDKEGHWEVEIGSHYHEYYSGNGMTILKKAIINNPRYFNSICVSEIEFKSS